MSDYGQPDDSDDNPSDIDGYYSDDGEYRDEGAPWGFIILTLLCDATDDKQLWEHEQENAVHYSPWDDVEENAEEYTYEDYVDEDNVVEYYADEDSSDEDWQAFILSQMGY
jgi:hypothetical protein